MTNNIFVILRKASRALNSNFKLDAEHTIPQYLVLSELSERDNRRLSDLSDATGIDRTTISDVLKRLENSGAVTVGKDPEDARAKLVSLTTEGRRLAKKLDRKAERIGLKVLPNENAVRQVVEALSEIIVKAEEQAAKEAKAAEKAAEKVSG